MTPTIPLSFLPIPRPLLLAFFGNLVWINISEVFRYFIFVMPMMREAFPQFADIAPMNLGVFMIWGIWDTILVLVSTGFLSIWFQRYGTSMRVVLIGATLIWSAIFVILWLGLFNMNLSTLSILSIALPLSWIEMLGAALIVKHSILRE